ncbi:hypothetical protein [Natronoarchaeum rubrum]|uniref:hypothetical protein n=1 Tax=Natronoarchaeum rubrum TaxID=755311 RepID=UPI002112021B|nr:hypothetical protein [Natronoarchaeum rubrum]
MTRRDELEALADRIAGFDGVERAWVAASFQDTLLFVEVPSGAALPDAVAELLEERGLTGANEAYGIDAAGASDAGNVGAYEQHRFVDTAAKEAVERPGST